MLCQFASFVSFPSLAIFTTSQRPHLSPEEVMIPASIDVLGPEIYKFSLHNPRMGPEAIKY